MSIVSTIERLDAISRVRALTLSESLRLERAIKAEKFVAPPKGKWSADEDRLALSLVEQGKSYAQIAKRIGRTPSAVFSRLRVIRRKHAQ